MFYGLRDTLREMFGAPKYPSDAEYHGVQITVSYVADMW